MDKTNRGYTRREFLKSTGLSGAMLLAGGILAACGANTQSTKSNKKPSGGSSETIKFMARGGTAYFSLFDELQKSFNKNNPDIHITRENVPGDYYQKFQLELAAGNPPDAIFECDCTITSSIRAGALTSLDNLMKGDSQFAKKNYLDIAWISMEWDNKSYGLPFDGGSLALYYNKELLEAAGIPYPDPDKPLTWDQTVQVATKLTLDRNGKHPGESGFDPKRIKQYGLDPASYYWQVWVYGAGGEVITADGKVPIDEPEAVQGLQFLADLGAKHYISPSPQFQQSGNISFQSGTVAMQYGGVWNIGAFRDAKFQWDVAPFPNGKTPVSTGWYSPLAITADSKAKEAAWKWISYCCSQQGQLIVAKHGENVPPVKKLDNTKAFLNPGSLPQHKKVFLDQLNPKLLRVPGDKMGKYWGGYIQKFGDIFNPAFDPVWTGKKTAEQAAKEVRPKLEKLLKTGKVS